MPWCRRDATPLALSCKPIITNHRQVHPTREIYESYLSEWPTYQVIGAHKYERERTLIGELRLRGGAEPRASVTVTLLGSSLIGGNASGDHPTARSVAGFITHALLVSRQVWCA